MGSTVTSTACPMTTASTGTTSAARMVKWSVWRAGLAPPVAQEKGTDARGRQSTFAGLSSRSAEALGVVLFLRKLTSLL